MLNPPSFSFKTLKGESWKQLPGFKSRYWISNFGRCASTFREGRLMKPLVRRLANGEISHLQFDLALNQRRQMISVSRIVYFLVVKRFDLNNTSIIVCHKDGDRSNCRWNNLELSTYSVLSKKRYEKAETHNNFQAAAKKVAQYDQHGRWIATYSSAVEAEKRTGISRRYINTAAARKGTSSGYWWRYDKFIKKLPKSEMLPLLEKIK